jgi:hypothetical protein
MLGCKPDKHAMNYGNLPGAYRSDYGIIITDNADGMKLQKLVRKMAVYNPIPHMISLYGVGSGYRLLPIRKIIEDPNSRDSKYSYIIQSCDVVAYFSAAKVPAKQLHSKNGGETLFRSLGSCLEHTWKQDRPTRDSITLTPTTRGERPQPLPRCDPNPSMGRSRITPVMWP